MTKYSKNKKLNTLLNAIEESLLELGLEEVKRYYNEFKREPDYNIAQYGNLLIYYDEVRNLYAACGYKTTQKFSNQKLWDVYKNQVGYIVRNLIHNY